MEYSFPPKEKRFIMPFVFCYYCPNKPSLLEPSKYKGWFLILGNEEFGKDNSL